VSLGLDAPRAAVVAIDCHRGHLDPAVATMPASPQIAARLIAANRRFLDAARALGLPVVHCVTTYRDAGEIAANPFWRTRAEDPLATRKNVLAHNIAGMPGCTIMLGLQAEGDIMDTPGHHRVALLCLFTASGHVLPSAEVLRLFGKGTI